MLNHDSDTVDFHNDEPPNYLYNYTQAVNHILTENLDLLRNRTRSPKLTNKVVVRKEKQGKVTKNVGVLIQINNIVDGLESFVDEVIMRILGKFKNPTNKVVQKQVQSQSHSKQESISYSSGSLSDDNDDDSHGHGSIRDDDIIITWQSFIKDKSGEEYDNEPLEYKQLDIELTESYIKSVRNGRHFIQLSLQDAISHIYKHQIEAHKRWATKNPTLAEYHTHLSHNRAVIASIYNTLDHCIRTELVLYGYPVHISSKIDHYSDVVLSSFKMPGIMIIFDGITHGSDHVGGTLLSSLGINEHMDGCVWYKNSHHLTDVMNNKKTLVGRQYFEMVLELTGDTLAKMAKEHYMDVLLCSRFSSIVQKNHFQKTENTHSSEMSSFSLSMKSEDEKKQKEDYSVVKKIPIFIVICLACNIVLFFYLFRIK